MARAAQPIDPIQAVCGMVCLGLGAALYAFARSTPAAFLPAALHWPLESLAAAPLAGALPTFAHTAAFSLLTASVARGSTVHSAIACATWTAINVLFEIGQQARVRVWLATHLAWPVEPAGLLDPVRRYFAHGVFDAYDIVAAVAGGAFGFAVIVATRRRGVGP